MLNTLGPGGCTAGRVLIATFVVLSSVVAWTGRALGDGHGAHSESGVTSLDVYVDGQTIHLLEASRPKGGPVELRHHRSDDGGDTWSQPVRVGARMVMPEGAHRGMDIQLAASGRRAVAAWQTKGTGAFGGGPIATAVSSDGGYSWRPGPNPADDGSTDGHGFIEVAADPEGVFHLVWLDSRDGVQGLRYARSTDGGLRWSANLTLDGETCECCWNSITTAPGGLVCVLYRDKDPRDMAIVCSGDGGRAWTKPVRAGRFDWAIEACPHVGGGLALERSGSSMTIRAAIWTGKGSEKGVHFLSSSDGGETWDPPKRLGDARAWHPDLASTGSGRVGVVWDARGPEGQVIYSAVSESGGKRWSEPRRLNGEGSTASHPRVVATPTGFRAFWTEKAAGKEMTWVSRRLDATRAGDVQKDRVASKGLDAISDSLARVKDVHGAAGPWAVAGYRMGERALKQLGLSRHDFRLLAIHRAPAEVQYSCVADGLQAATGVSDGKLNLKFEELPVEQLSTVVEDRKSGRRLTFTLRPKFARSICDLPHERLEGEGRRVAGLADDDIFIVVEEKTSNGK